MFKGKHVYICTYTHKCIHICSVPYWMHYTQGDQTGLILVGIPQSTGLSICVCTYVYMCAGTFYMSSNGTPLWTYDLSRKKLHWASLWIHVGKCAIEMLHMAALPDEWVHEHLPRIFEGQDPCERMPLKVVSYRYKTTAGYQRGEDDDAASSGSVDSELACELLYDYPNGVAWTISWACWAVGWGFAQLVQLNANRRRQRKEHAR